MSDIHGNKHINAIRRKLYSRGERVEEIKRHNLTDTEVEVKSDWNSSTKKDFDGNSTEKKPQQKRYRLYILLGSLAVFVLVTTITSAYLLLGGNQISGDNIVLGISGPNSVSGGETINLQIAITNNNDVAIDSTVLVVKYPPGTRSADEEKKELFEERIALNKIEPGESRNVQIDMVAYGEEGDQLKVEAFIEYRIQGSNSVFIKESEPLMFEIINSPIVISIDSIENVSSGKEVEVTISVRSNSENTLSNLLVTASYPSVFSFLRAEPDPDLNRDVWRIDELEPEETETITLVGKIEGFARESASLNVTVGPANPDNQFLLDATLARASHEFFIESPFIGVSVSVDGNDGTVVLEPGQDSDVEINLTNTLNESVYDLTVEVIPSGITLGPNSIASQNGFYDSNRGVILFDVTNNSDFNQITPGDTRSVRLTISPTSVGSAASYSLAVNVYARRVSDTNAQEQLIGTSKLEAKYTSVGDLNSQATHMSGPIPPKVGQKTKYLVTLSVKAGSNNLTGVSVETSLPSYITWLNEHSGGSEVEFNSVNNSLIWQAGSIGNGQEAKLNFAIELLPSSSQVGINPVLVNEQQLTAVDGFTGVSITDSNERITTELNEGDGKVEN